MVGAPPPANNPRVEFDPPAGDPFLLTVELPKSVEFPVDAKTSVSIVLLAESLPTQKDLTLDAQAPPCLALARASPKSIAFPAKSTLI